MDKTSSISLMSSLRPQQVLYSFPTEAFKWILLYKNKKLSQALEDLDMYV